MDILEQVFGVLGSAGGEFITFLKGMLSSIVSIFYTAGTSGADGSLTDIGVLTLVGVASSFVFFALRWFTKLLKLRG